LVCVAEDMITWQRVIDVSEISGSADNREGGITETDVRGLNSERSQTTERSGVFNWFAGIDEGGGGETSSTPNHPDIFDFQINRTDNFEGDFPFGAQFITGLDYSYSAGETSITFYGYDVSIDDGDFTLGGAIENNTVEINTDWSRSTRTLTSYELTTLSNQVGTTTTEEATTTHVTTTSNQEVPFTTTSEVPFTTTSEVPVTTTSEVPFTITRPTIVNTFEVPTWTNTLTYETTFVTGQTTAQAFSEFVNFVPGVVLQDAPLALTTKSTAVTPLTFVEREGADRQVAPFTRTSLAPAQTVSATRTVPTIGSTVLGTFPVVAALGTKITSQTQQQQTTSLAADDFGEQISKTLQTTQVFNNLVSHVEFAGVSASAQQTQSYTQQIIDPDAYFSSSSYTEFGGVFSYSESQSESAALKVTNYLAVQPVGQLSVAHSVEVAVRAVSDGEGGASYEQVAQGNNFFRNTMTGFIPATGAKTQSDSSYSFSGNSYTVKAGTNPTSSSVFTVAGQSTSQWTLNASPLTIAGGPIAGDIFISHGLYETHADSSSGTTRVESVLAQSWEANAPTTAWRTVQTWRTSSFATPVSALTRHNITAQPLDD
jgi:hypothetical protein